MQNILLTGAAGFIGSHLAEELVAQDFNVIGLDNYDEFYSRGIKEQNISSLRNTNSFQLIEGNIRNKQLLTEIMKSNSIDIVIHLAAKAGVQPSIQNPSAYVDTNVVGTMNVLDAMRSTGVQRLLFASSSSVYGDKVASTLQETDAVDLPISPYAATKRAGELLCHTYHHLFGMHIYCMRFFTVYGPRQRPDMAIHKFVHSIAIEAPIDLFGIGNTYRDYTYIDDIVSGLVLAMNKLDGFNIFNLGESKKISINDLLELIQKIMDKKARITYLPLRPGDVRNTCASIVKAQNSFGYNPVVDIYEGLHRYYKWYLEQSLGTLQID